MPVNYIQQANFEWFKEHMPELYEKLGPCHVVVKDMQAVSVHKTFAEGVDSASKLFEPGTYLVQEVGPDESVYTFKVAGACL